MKTTAVIVAAGRGTRMGSDIPKQYLELAGKPVLYYTIRVFEDSPLIDSVVLVTAADQEAYCRREIAERFGFRKITAIVPGGETRCDSVENGLAAAEGSDLVLIQDGVRPFVTEKMLKRGIDCALRHGNAIAGMPVKDTIKRVSADGRVKDTPDRKTLWQVQTPQIFRYDAICEAYRNLSDADRESMTDDAMVMEQTGTAVYMFEGDYRNIKITTPEDLITAEGFLAHEP